MRGSDAKGNEGFRIIKLMIVEDQELLRKSLKIVLESSPQLSVTASAGHGKEAIALCQAELPDVILMDLQMPIMNGVEATKVIKNTWPEVKVIILTTFQEIDYVRDALNAGAEGYILKAVDPDFLMKGIELVYHGGSLIPQHLAREVYQSLHKGIDDIAPAPSAETLHHLTDQELKILKLLSLGLNNKAISERMYLSMGTVKNYVSSIYSKLDVKNRSSAVSKAIEESLIPVKKE
ncbi:MAG: response regulator transcription factor [Tuberibacillus sp.]